MTRWLIGLSLWISVSAQAQENFYFTVEGAASPSIENYQVDPTDEFQIWKNKIEQIVDLMSFKKHNQPMPIPSEKYNRLKHFGEWRLVEDCHDTRTTVLIRDSKVPVKFKTGNPCKVDRGQWFDPYTGKTFNRASDVQIDHVVALKNAYVSGAWDWDSKTRCLYANFMSNELHLIPVMGVENQKKGDKGPEGYMPPRAAYKCEYLKNWLEIKLVWGLALTAIETEAIQELAQNNNCSISKLRTTMKRILEQRQAISENAEYCSEH